LQITPPSLTLVPPVTTLTRQSSCIALASELPPLDPPFQVANGDTITTTKRAVVPLSTKLSTKATVGHIFEHLKSGSLISIGQLCNDNCVTLFTKYDVKIYKNGHVIIVGKRNVTNGFWNIPLAPKPAL
jgi:tRNA splicing ligase